MFENRSGNTSRKVHFPHITRGKRWIQGLTETEMRRLLNTGMNNARPVSKQNRVPPEFLSRSLSTIFESTTYLLRRFHKLHSSDSPMTF